MIVYTAIFDSYDNLVDPCEVNREIEYVCFTDDPELESNIWDVRIFEREEMNPAEMNRLLKFFPHVFLEEFDSDVSLYIDGKVQILSNLDEIFDAETKSPIAAPKHPERSTIAEEAARLIELDKADPEQIRKQLERYERQGYTDQLPLTDNCVLLRDHSDPKLQKAMDDWWHEFRSGVNRDQICFGYSLWKNDVELQLLDYVPEYNLTISQDNQFRLHPHRADGLKNMPWKLQFKYRDTCSTDLISSVLYSIATLSICLKMYGIHRTIRLLKSDIIDEEK